MAMSDWKGSRWTQVWSNGTYKAEVQWNYKQDPIANQTHYQVMQIRITSLKSAYSFRNTAATAGIATIASGRKTQKVSANVAGGKTQTFNVANDSRTFNMNSDGSCPSGVNVHGYFKAGINANKTPEFGWTVAEITGKIAKIDRSGGTTTISVASKSYNSVTMNVTSSVATTLIQYSLNGGTTWTDAGVDLPNTGGGTTSFTIGGLSPNTTYSIKVRHRRDWNQVYSSGATVSVTTNKPAAPTKGSVSVSSKTYNSITYSISGFSFGAGGGWGAYQWSTNNSSWTSIGSSTSFTRIGLSPNTSYTTYVRLVDNYGSASASASVAATTNKPAAPSGGTVSVSEITYNSAKMTYSGFKAGAGAKIARYDVAMRQEPGNVPWVDNGLKTSYTGTGLPPNTNCIARVTAVDNFGQRSGYVDAYFKTKKPAAGNGATITTSVSVTTSTATILLSGGTAGAGGSRSYYRYYWNGAWHNLGAGTNSFTLTGLTAGTDYSVQVGFVDNYGTASSSKTVEFTTYQPGTPTAGTISVTQNAEGKYTVTASGFAATTPATIKQYVFTFGIKTIKTDTNTATFFPVMPNTLYQVSCYVIDDFNQRSNVVTIPYETFGEIPEVNIILGKMLIMTAESTSTITVDTVDNLIDDLVRS